MQLVSRPSVAAKAAKPAKVANAAVAMLAAFCVPAMTACSPTIATPAQRLDYLEDHFDEAREGAMGCDESTATFVSTEKIGTGHFDRYRVQGCGQSTDFMVQLRKNGDWLTWAFSPIPPNGRYLQELKTQLLNTAKFDMGCPQIEFVVLHEVIAPMRTGYQATVGAQGCDKKNTYVAGCNLVSFTGGKHEITCQGKANTAPQ